MPIQRFLATLGYELSPIRKSYDDFVLGLISRQRVDVLVDVGANHGQYARRFRDRGFTGKVISFEPLGDAFDRLSKEARSDSCWTVRRMALGSRPSTAELYVAANSVSSSLLPMGSLHAEAEPASRLVRTETVRVSTLDEQLSDEPSSARFWLKLDVQGYESAVLAGGPRVLGRSAVVQCELSTRELYAGQVTYLDVLKVLDEASFHIVQVIPGFVDPRTGDLLQFDVIAARPEVASDANLPAALTEV